MDDAADESVAAALAFLPDPGSVASFSGACRRLLGVARADRIWLPLVDRRWRFGPLPAGAAQLLPPGERHRAAASAMAGAAEAPLSVGEADAFAFFARRCRGDAEVLALAIGAEAPAEARRRGPSAPLGRGALVRVEGLAQQPQLNGCLGALGGAAEGGRLPVVLVGSLRTLSVRPENLAVVAPPVSEADAEERVLAAGGEAIDALARLAGHASARPALLGGARRLLAAATERWAVQQWQLLLGSDRADLLEEGGLVVSQWAEPEAADIPGTRARLAELAEAVLRRTSAQAPLRARVEAVSSVLFDDCGFGGNADDYYDPRNSFLHRVVERRKGIPISLSIVWVAVARRVDVPCFLCAHMPAHILIRVTASGQPSGDLFVDAFGRRVMDFEGLLAFSRQLGLAEFKEQFVAQRPATAVYARLLRNLIHIYREKVVSPGLAPPARKQLLQRLRATCSQAIAVADPSSVDEVNDLKRMQEEANIQERRL